MSKVCPFSRFGVTEVCPFSGDGVTEVCPFSGFGVTEGALLTGSGRGDGAALWKTLQQSSAQRRLSLHGVSVPPEALANFSLFPLEKEKNLGFQISSGKRGRTQRSCSRSAEGRRVPC